MPTKEERNLEDELGPSPWPLYADREEPWKDYKLLLTLEDKFEYQYEIAHVLGCDASKISYWLDKAHDEYTPELPDGALECVRFDVCGYEAVNPDSLCPTCLALVRHNDAQPEPIDVDDYDSMDAFFEAMYDEYGSYERNNPTQ